MLVQTFAELRCCSFYEARGGEVVEKQPGEYRGGSVTNVVYRWSPRQTSDAGRYSLRAATMDDFEFVHTLERAAYREHVIATYGAWDDPWQRERLASRFDPAAVQIVVAGGRAVGQLVVEWDEDPVFLVAIELLPELRGRGIGSVVIRDVLDHAGRMGKRVRRTRSCGWTSMLGATARRWVAREPCGCSGSNSTRSERPSVT